MRYLCLIMAACVLAGCAATCPAGRNGRTNGGTEALAVSGECRSCHQEYETSAQCRSCHEKIYDQHLQSMHHRSASNPVFLAQYFKELLPGMKSNPGLDVEAVRCTACHNPIEFAQTGGGFMESPEPAKKGLRAVTCDVCHTITGHQGNAPGNGNYVTSPDSRKVGPIRGESFHYRYSPFVKTSEFCGICHNASNHHGLDVKSTYAEWKSSIYAEQKIQCQDCHMNRTGYLKDGKPEFDRGPLVIERMCGTDRRNRRIYSHLFPGPYSITQIEGSVDLSVKTEVDTFAPGQEITVAIDVCNGRAGHKMPTGSADIHVLWLDIRVFTRSGEVPVEIRTDLDAPENRYAVSGGAEVDWITDDVPKGKRVYRAVFADKAGKPTLAFYNAAKNIFDNRLNAAEVRREQCRFTAPDAIDGPVVIKASLKYLPYPASFAKKLDIVKARSFEIATAKKELTLAPAVKQ